MAIIPSDTKMFIAFGPIIFLLGISPKEIIQQEERSSVSTKTYTEM